MRNKDIGWETGRKGITCHFRLAAIHIYVSVICDSFIRSNIYGNLHMVVGGGGGGWLGVVVVGGGWWVVVGVVGGGRWMGERVGGGGRLGVHNGVRYKLGMGKLALDKIP